MFFCFFPLDTTTCAFEDWIRRNGQRFDFKTHRRGCFERQHYDDTHGNVRDKNCITARVSEIHFGPETDEHLPESDTSQV